jgi:NADH-quinone oxidoreductase subunit L
VDDVITTFLQGSFERTSNYEEPLKEGLLVFGLGLGTVLALIGIAIAHRIWVVKPGTSTRVQERLGWLYELLSHAWYFNELIDALVVRPTAAAGAFAKNTFERAFVDDTLIGGTTGIVRAGSAAVRAVQNGFVRYYAALLIVGVAGVGFYFLLQS